MSHKYRIIKEQDSYVLPRIKEMHCDVRAFLSPELYEQTDEKLWGQAVQAASYPGVRAVYLMPDTHIGYGVPIGSVVITEGTLIQSASGYDISCGMLWMETTLKAWDVRDPEKRKRWIEEVEKRVATGVGSHRPEKMPAFDSKMLDEIFLHGAEPLDINIALCERSSIPVDTEYFDPQRIPRALGRALPQLGSLGGGNHFIEMLVDPIDGAVSLLIHCGSRGFGHQTAEFFFQEGADLRGLPRKQRENSWLREDEELGRRYWNHHNAAANFAIANRHIIARSLAEATSEVFSDHYAFTTYEISHNLIQKERVQLEEGGKWEDGFVHRKGATRALPTGHPSLGLLDGHMCIIPGSMLEGAAILLPEANAWRSGFSVNHGSGRLLGRNQAKKAFGNDQEEIDAEMRNSQVICEDGAIIEGVVLNTEKTPLDECSRVYKALDDTLRVLTDNGVARIQRRMYPVANIKGA